MVQLPDWMTTLIFVNHFTYLGSNLSSTKRNTNIHIEKSIERLITISTSDISTILPRCSYVRIILWLYPTHHSGGKLDRNYWRMLFAFLNKSGKQCRTKHQLYTHAHPISETTQVRRTRHARHYWRSKNEFISDKNTQLLADLKKKYTHHLSVDTECSLKVMSWAMTETICGESEWKGQGNNKREKESI